MFENTTKIHISAPKTMDILNGIFSSGISSSKRLMSSAPTSIPVSIKTIQYQYIGNIIRVGLKGRSGGITAKLLGKLRPV